MIKLPQLTRSIFWDQFIFMQIAGFLIGISAPFFWLWYGIPAEYVMKWDFFVTAQLAGQMVGLVSFFLITIVIRPHLKLLASRMEAISNAVESKNLLSTNDGRHIENSTIDVQSVDEIGVSAKAYNNMLASLIQSQKVESVYSDFSAIMSETLESKKLAERTIDLLIDKTDVQAAAILIKAGGELRLLSSQAIMSADDLLNHTLVLNCVRSSNRVKIDLPDDILLDGVMTQFRPTRIMLHPIEFKSSQIGVLVTATSVKKVDSMTNSLLNMISSTIGLAINNTIIHSNFQKLAAIDSLTNIYNRRYGMDRLKEEFARVERNQSSFSVAMIDIDHFKNINDTYGHLVGDNAIVSVCETIKSKLRDGDIVMRYGGEEFLILLYGASCRDALMVTERIRHQIEESVIDAGNNDIKLTISAGLASYPVDLAKTEMDLVDMADQALLIAKQTGRNKTVPFSKMLDTH